MGIFKIFSDRSLTVHANCSLKYSRPMEEWSSGLCSRPLLLYIINHQSFTKSTLQTFLLIEWWWYKNATNHMFRVQRLSLYLMLENPSLFSLSQLRSQTKSEYLLRTVDFGRVNALLLLCREMKDKIIIRTKHSSPNKSHDSRSR